MDFQSKIKILKQYEAECYQVCFYLTDDSEAAGRAAEETIVDLFASATFWSADEAVRRKAIRAAAFRRCVELLKRAVAV
ncbi:hypothetical protein ACFOQM_22840 [Paenibacillus sp. GCM10012307]|uniref:Uncharacterized protein n=1 Tax=Paenibacillus roseus TaxID=2798579 RepID=A0A934J6A2_9BACL|nr:hypothetical protein [Paenibacillus roseus]MBJ6364064.1 hypothetical protein [Paenibacillus roseus]